MLTAFRVLKRLLRDFDQTSRVADRPKFETKSSLSLGKPAMVCSTFFNLTKNKMAREKLK